MGLSMRRPAAVVVCLMFSSLAGGASINYGNFGPVAPGVSFLQVTESSITDPVPLYGPPSVFPVGVDFTPVGFGSSSSVGSADITEAQLNFTIDGSVLPQTFVEISTIAFSEAGDYTMAGAGGAATSVAAGAIIRATVTEINGLAVTPINLIPVNASFSDSLPGAVIASPWSLGGLLDVKTQLLGLGFTANDFATTVEVVIDNALASSSEASTAASIVKKDFRVDTTTGFVLVIPEPGVLTLTGIALGVLTMRRRRRGLPA